jgi:hypothetical protein
MKSVSKKAVVCCVAIVVGLFVIPLSTQADAASRHSRAHRGYVHEPAPFHLGFGWEAGRAGTAFAFRPPAYSPYGYPADYAYYPFYPFEDGPAAPVRPEYYLY